MKKIKNYFLLSMLALCCSFAASCSDDKDDPTIGTDPEPTPEELATPTLRFAKETVDKYDGSDISILTENADTIHYRYSVPQGDNDNIDPAAQWQKIVVDKTLTRESAAASKEDSTVIHIDLDINLESRVIYVMEAYASITKDKESKQSDAVTKKFQSIKANYIEVNSLLAGPSAVVFDAEIVPVKGLSEENTPNGYCYMIYAQNAYTKDDFLSNVQYAEPITGNGKQGQFYDIMPNTTYKLAIVAVKATANDWGGSSVDKTIGEPILHEFTTPIYAVGSSNTTVSLQPGAANYQSVSMDVTAGEGAVGFYYGAVKTADMNGATIEDFLGKNDWFTANAASYFKRFLDMNNNEQLTTVSARITNLAASTDYTVFAIAADTVGIPGKVVSTTMTTSALTFNSKASVTLTTVSAEYERVTLSCAFQNGCTKAAYGFREHGTISLEDGKELALANVEDPMYCFTTDGESKMLEHLIPNTQYDLFVIPVDKDNQFGALQKYEFKTKGISFDGNAKVSAQITHTVKGEWGLIYTITMTKGENCAKYLYGATYNMGEQDDLEYAKTVLMNSYSIMESSEATMEYELDYWGDAAKFVVIPVDADGNNGVPVVLDCPGNAVTNRAAAKAAKAAKAAQATKAAKRRK